MRARVASFVFAAVATIVPAVPAMAQYPGTQPPEVLPSDTETPGPSVQVGGRKDVRGVAVTGADVAGLAVIGGVAVAGGILIRRASRRPTP
jgi:hypothetical protein